MKSLKKKPESEYESDQCLESFKKIDSSFNEEKSRRIEIAISLAHSEYPGSFIVNFNAIFILIKPNSNVVL